MCTTVAAGNGRLVAEHPSAAEESSSFSLVSPLSLGFDSSLYLSLSANSSHDLYGSRGIYRRNGSVSDSRGYGSIESRR